jgi:tRNA(Ile)-lysidine synthase
MMLDRLTIERMLAKADDGPILIALSGGGDSVALLILLWEMGLQRKLRALIVDHKLRAGSSEDAHRAADIASSYGVNAYIEDLTWPDGANPGHGAARTARYSVLCNAARKCGARVIATGHTRDDQAETVVLRATRGSGLRGLSGMRALSPAPLWPEGRGYWIARPLLGVRRQELRDYLHNRGDRWIEDPANINEAYARVRARKVMGVWEEKGFDPMRLAALAERLAPQMDQIDARVAALIEAAASFNEDEVSVARTLWSDDLTAVNVRALQALVTAAGGHERGPTSEQAGALEAAIAARSFTSATLGGALIRGRGDQLIFSRDRGALAGRADGTLPIAPLELSPGKEAIWDRRLALTAEEPGWSVVFENGVTQLARGEERAALAVASPHWLLRTRVRHVLGRN